MENAELPIINTIENENSEDKTSKFIYIKGQNFKWCGISNGRKILKVANFWNFRSFPY